MEVWQLKQRQGLPLEIKERYTEKRIRDWYIHWGGKVYLSFSGGKDSTVLLHLVRRIFPEVPAVFIDTGLEYPEIREFVQTVNNVIWLRPRIMFKTVLERYGYPVVSKRIAGAIYRYRLNPGKNEWRLIKSKAKGYISKKWRFLLKAPFKISDYCCNHLKVSPMQKYARKSGRYPMLGIMADEGDSRAFQYRKQGCNAFNLKSPVSWPMAFWQDKDIWDYIHKYDLGYSRIYDMGETRTGCMFCMFALGREGENNRFVRMENSHPKRHRFCIHNLGCGRVMDFMGIPHSLLN